MERMTEVNDLLDLAKRCQVTMYAACKKSGVNMSTVDRWKHGRHGKSGPTLSKLKAVRQAVIDLARERGTLPEGVEA